MTTKTDLQTVGELKDKFKPANPAVITDDEAKLVKDILEIDARNDIELQNIRDMTVMLFGQWASAAKPNHLDDVMSLMDAMSAVCTVIDGEKMRRGLPT